MRPSARPISVLIVACLYIAVGAIGFAYHFRELTAFHNDAIGIEVTELLALVAGVFMLLGHNWARWLALAWIAFHVGLSAFHAFRELAVHCVFLIAIAACLLNPAAGRYFRGGQIETT
jgi:hypothetical protein